MIRGMRKINWVYLGDFNAQLGLKGVCKEDEKYIGNNLSHDFGDLFKLFLHTSQIKNVSSKIA